MQRLLLLKVNDMKKVCYQLEGINRKSGLKETIFVNDTTKEGAIRQAETFADSVVYIKEYSLGKGW